MDSLDWFLYKCRIKGRPINTPTNASAGEAPVIPLSNGLYAVPVVGENVVKDEHGCILSAVIEGQTIFFGCMLQP